jgi:hypothetical protein
VGDFEVGKQNVAGHFLVAVQAGASMGTYQVMTIEAKDGVHYYVHLIRDPRFAWLGWTAEMPKFERRITEDDLVEYNAYVGTAFHVSGAEAMPVITLTERSVGRLIDLCKKLTKQDKKTKWKKEPQP